MSAAQAALHRPWLRAAEQFEDAPQQMAAAKLGMWVFVTTETPQAE